MEITAKTVILRPFDRKNVQTCRQSTPIINKRDFFFFFVHRTHFLEAEYK